MKIKIVLFIAFMTLLILPVNGYYYTIPFYSLSNNPIDSVTTYIGNRPQVPAGAANMSMIRFPTSGTIEGVEVMDYSTTVAGSAETYNYSIRINNQTEYLIDNLAVNTNERRFTNLSYSIPITEGDWFEIKRIHPKWATNPTGNLVSGYVLFNSTVRGYVIPIMALTTTPGDAARNYMGLIPAAPATTSGQRKIYIPSGGIISRIDIYDNSSGATPGSAETIYYQLEINGQQNGLGWADGVIPSGGISVSTSQRFFNRTFPTSFAGFEGVSPYTVLRGEYIELYRKNPTWATNPLLNIVGGNIFINTTENFDNDLSDGYPLFFYATTVSPTGTYETRYLSNLLAAPSLTGDAVDRPMYSMQGGNITNAMLYSYSGTAGQADITAVPFIKAGVVQVGRIGSAVSNVSSAERLWTIDAKSKHELVSGFYGTIDPITSTQWYTYTTEYGGTKPATTIYGGWMWLEYITTFPGVFSALPVTSDFSANLTSTGSHAVIQFFDQSNNTIPGITTYRWNFTDGGTGSDSTDINPIFTYTSPGSYTINHTVVNGAVTSKMSKSLTITGTTPSTVPNASFVITLTDTSINIPTSWQWNATNLTGDNVERTFSTSQNQIWNLTKSGNYLIKLIATNSFGSNSTNMTIGYGLTNPKVYFWNRTG